MGLVKISLTTPNEDEGFIRVWQCDNLIEKTGVKNLLISVCLKLTLVAWGCSTKVYSVNLQKLIENCTFVR